MAVSTATDIRRLWLYSAVEWSWISSMAIDELKAEQEVDDFSPVHRRGNRRFRRYRIMQPAFKLLGSHCYSGRHDRSAGAYVLLPIGRERSAVKYIIMGCSIVKCTALCSEVVEWGAREVQCRSLRREEKMQWSAVEMKGCKIQCSVERCTVQWNAVQCVAL